MKSNLEKKIKIKFKNKTLLKTALTHRSYLNEHPEEKIEHNERLEFLGDAVLELIITEFLFKKYPNKPEGDLTSFRSALVCTKSLAETSRKLKIGEYLKMSKGEEETGGRDKDYLLANTFEALLGAIYLDKDYKTCTRFVKEHLTPKIQAIVANRLDINSKTKLQEKAQEKLDYTPIYEIIDEKGPDHEKIFTTVVKINDKVFGRGVGKSKQEAEEKSAKQALQKLAKI